MSSSYYDALLGDTEQTSCDPREQQPENDDDDDQPQLPLAPPTSPSSCLAGRCDCIDHRPPWIVARDECRGLLYVPRWKRRQEFVKQSKKRLRETQRDIRRLE